MALAGCSSIGTAPGRPEREVVNTTFRRTASGDGRKLMEEAQVEWNDNEEQVIVTGAVTYGSSSCNEATLEGVAYDSTADRLTVEVGFREQSPGPTSDGNGVKTCTTDLAMMKYIVEISFAGELPGQVVVKQNHNQLDDTVTRVNRSE